LPTRVIDEASDRSAFENACDCGLDGLFLADIEGAGFALAAVLNDFGLYAVEFVLCAAGNDDLCAQARELMRGAAPDAAAATGNDDAFPRKSPSLKTDLYPE